MRLIDADAFKKWLLENSINEREEKESQQIGILIDAFPTAESRKKGKWIITGEFSDCRYAKCNQCNVTQIFYYGKPLTNYCPNCGSYNGGEQDEN
jgi:hypothetical protein